MKLTNTSNYRQKIKGVWIEPGETEEVDSDISDNKLSKDFRLEDDSTSTTEDGSDDEDDEEKVSKSEEKQDNKGD